MKKIKLSTYDSSDIHGGIDLDFKQNHLLQFIQLDMPECRYYTFDHELGKLWKNLDQEVKQQEITPPGQENRFLYYFVNLAWDITKDIEIQLSKCRL